MNSHVFISYAREDQRAALRIHGDLLRVGITPWLDVFDLVAGQDWRYAIRQALRSSSHVLLLISRRAMSKRGYVHNEVREALDILSEVPPGEVYVIPVRLEDVDPMHEGLERLQWVDLFADYNSGFEKIAQSLGVPNAVQLLRTREEQSWARVEVLLNKHLARAKAIEEQLAAFGVHIYSRFGHGAPPRGGEVIAIGDNVPIENVRAVITWLHPYFQWIEPTYASFQANQIVLGSYSVDSEHFSGVTLCASLIAEIGDPLMTTQRLIERIDRRPNSR